MKTSAANSSSNEAVRDPQQLDLVGSVSPRFMPLPILASDGRRRQLDDHVLSQIDILKMEMKKKMKFESKSESWRCGILSFEGVPWTWDPSHACSRGMGNGNVVP
jgi:hypothetical protein